MSWPLTKLDDVCEFVRGPFGGALKKDSFVETGYAVYEQQHAIYRQFSKIRYHINSTKFEDLKRFELKTGDLIMSCSGTMGKIAKVPSGIERGIINQALLKLTPTENVNLDFLAYWMESDLFQSQLNDNSHGAAIKNVASVKVLKQLKIPLPPLAKQQKIASILDAADQLRQKDQQLIDHYTSLSQSLFLEMFGDPVINPMEWKYKTLKELCLKITDGTHHSPPPINSGVPYVTAKHVKSYGLDFFSKPTYVSQDDHEGIYARCAPENGDVLYIKDGATTGIACLNTFNEPISLLSSLALLKTKPASINNHFLCFWLNHSGIKQKLIQQYMSGAAIQRYTLAKINTFSLVLPPIELQNQFAQHIEKIEQQKQYAQASREQSETLFNSLLQRAFKGELT